MNSKNNQELLKKIPAVDRLLNSPPLVEAALTHPRNLILRAIDQVLNDIRAALRSNEGSILPSDLEMEKISARIIDELEILGHSSLRPVINATGIIIHTNLGRSPLAETVLKKFRPVAGSYCNLEYNLDAATRGSRYSHVEGILKELTSAEAAMVVNNNAAAVLLSLETLAKEREVVVSRGQLVEIGGSFRIPDVMRKSGAKMIEVGATNKTHLRDYEERIGPETALLLKVHRSNFQVVGFAEEVGTAELVKLGRKYGIPVMEDLGSGSFIDFSKYGLEKEPTVQEVLADGVDLVTFSGDKMLGGPQAGIILGSKQLIESIRNNQLTRALRIDKLTLLALEETLRLYRDENTALREIPTLKMLTQPYNRIVSKARRLVNLIGKINKGNFDFELIDGLSKVGGGSLPLMELKSRLLSIIPVKLSANDIEERLRAFDPPIIVRIEKNQVLMDLRTIMERELKTIARAITQLSEI